jgi:hypothetical protein
VLSKIENEGTFISLFFEVDVSQSNPSKILGEIDKLMWKTSLCDKQA